MDRLTAGATDAESRRPWARDPRRLLAAGLTAAVVLLAVITVLAYRLAAAPGPGRAGARPAPAASPTLTIPAIYQKVKPSVVVVRTARGLGAGVIVADKGTILTANHVISGAKTVTVTFVDGTSARASVTAADPKEDIAVLAPAQLPEVARPASLGGAAEVGAPVVAIGNPLGLTDSVSAGIISGLNRTAQTNNGTFSGLIQFDASVNPGSAGGPLIDAQGLVIGIVVSIANPAHENAFAGIGFAMPIGSALGGGNSNGTGANGPQI